MNRYYLIVPVVLLALFGGIYWQHGNTAAAAATVRATETARLKAEADAKKADAERIAREDAARRTAERVAEETKKEAEKRAKWIAEGARIEEETARFAARITEVSSEIARAETELAAQRTATDSLNRENFDLAREIELARIAKRNAELEIQRAVDVVAGEASRVVPVSN